MQGFPHDGANHRGPVRPLVQVKEVEEMLNTASRFQKVPEHVNLFCGARLTPAANRIQF